MNNTFQPIATVKNTRKDPIVDHWIAVISEIPSENGIID